MEIIRSFRKSLSIEINDRGEVIVKAPYLFSKKKILQFVTSKQKWIEKKLQLYKDNIKFQNSFNFKNNVYINGHRMNWEECRRDKRETKKSFYSKKCLEMLLNKANLSSKIIKKPISFKICSSTRIWGSCDIKNNIKLNWKLIILPEELQDYVIYHELAHTKEMNHSKKFWGEVEKMCPNYKKCRESLKKYSFLLKSKVLD